MSTYKAIVGKKIKSVSSDPSDSVDGQMWYNTATQSLRGLAVLEAFTSGGSLITGRQSGAGAGTQTAALYNGGNPDTNLCENYNGSGWASIANLNNNHQYAGGCGTETSALVYGDYPEANTTEEFNGSAWSAQEGFSTARRSGASFGLETAALLCGGTTGPAVSTATEKYNGETWTGSGALSQARQYFAGLGVETAGLVFGGSNNPNATRYTDTEEYNGSTWATGGALPVATQMTSSFGTQTAGALAGGYKGSYSNTCLKYDGTSWSASPATLATARAQTNTSGVGTVQSAGLVSGGTPGSGQTGATEEFNASTNVITAAAWSSGGNLNTGRELGGNAGTSTAGLLMSGKVYPNSFKNETEEYNGSTWSEQNNVSTARATSGAGTQTAGIIFGGTNGAPGSTGVQTATEEYDGSSWTNGGALSTARMGMYGAGLQTACFGAGGTNSSNSPVTTVEDYNGSSWTSGTAIPTAQQGGGGAGLPSARLVFAGYAPYANFTIEGDGEGWTAGGNMIDARGQLAGFGSQTDALACAGSTSAPNVDTTAVEGYDGTSWSTRPSLSTERMGLSPGGAYNTTTGGMVVGGSNSGNPMRNQTEEWSPETTAANIETFSTS